jgi:hypothetical protein
VRKRLRRLFPPNGPGYELFDTCALLFGLGVMGYMLTRPPTETVYGLPPLRLLDHVELGVFMAAAGLVGMVCAYFPRAWRFGYIVGITVALALATNFFIGGAQGAGDRLFAAGLVYAWIARRLMRDNLEVRGPSD